MKLIMIAPRLNKEEKTEFLKTSWSKCKKKNWVCNVKTELYLRGAEFKEPKSLSSKYGELQCFVYSILLFTFSVVYVQKIKTKPCFGK